MLAARRSDRLEALAAELGSQAQVLVLPTDIADPASLYRLANAAGERFGAIDVWINNAGTTHREGMAWWEEDPSFVQEMVTVNLTAPMVSVGAAMPWLKKSKGAHIINVGSISGHVALKGVYSATKFGLRGHTEALRRELHALGIQVSLVSPGLIATEMTRAQSYSEKHVGPEVVAEVMVRLVEGGAQREVVVPGSWWLQIWLTRLFPRLVDRIIARRIAKKRFP